MYNCRCMLVSLNPPPPAEEMLECAEEIKRFHGIVDAPAGCEARTALALKLRNRPAVALRALLEGYSIEDIVRELY